MQRRPQRWVVLSGVLVGLVGCASRPVHAPPLVASHAAEPAGTEPAPGPSDRAGQTPSAGLPEAVATWWPEITAAAGRHGLPPELVAQVIWLESNGDPAARSPMGALGLMQLMPSTAAHVARARDEAAPTPDELLDPARNLELGCAHLAALLAEHGAAPLDGAAVHRLGIAYNGGTKVLEAWQRGEPLPAETERYAAALRERWEAATLPPR